MKKENNVFLENNTIVFLYKDNKIKVNIIYRKRKTISLRIIPKDNIEIISPKSVKISYLKEIIIKKTSWIIKTLDKFENIDSSFSERKYVNKEIFYYLGKEYKLNIIEEQNLKRKNYTFIYIDKNELIIKTNNNDKDFIKSELKKWYKIESEKIVNKRLEILKNQSSIMKKLCPNIIKVKEQKRRWGSCTSGKNIYINSKISMANIEAIDYILVHEFCHLVYMNHSKDFYNLVYNIFPNFRNSEKWLKENSYKLSL